MLIITVPNFSGLNKLIISLFSKHMLKMHNLGILNLTNFSLLFRYLDLDIIYLGYLGSFDFVIYDLPFFRNQERYRIWNQFLKNIFVKLPYFECGLISPDIMIVARKV